MYLLGLYTVTMETLVDKKKTEVRPQVWSTSHLRTHLTNRKC